MLAIGKNRRNRLVPNLIMFALVISFMLLLPMRCLAQASDSSAEASGVAADQQGGSGQSPAANSDSAEKADTSGGGEPVKLEWNTKFAYSPIFRVAKQSQELISTAYDAEAMNLDDGDRNFHRGLVSNRVDVFSELDVNFGQDWGIRASTEAWFDSIYNQRTADNSPSTYNALSSDYQHFPAGTKDFQYLSAYLLDAFASGNVRLGGTTLSLRGGQFALGGDFGCASSADFGLAGFSGYGFDLGLQRLNLLLQGDYPSQLNHCKI